MDEQELITNIKNGDNTAFKQLFDQYRHFVYNICYRMSGNREEAEDATQDVFVKIFHSIERFRGEAKLSSWIYRIAVNTCLKRERQKKLANWVSLDILFQNKKEFYPIDHEDAPEQQMEHIQREQIVQGAIRQLPARQKAALILHRYQDLSYEEIAQVMEISLSAVESLLHRSKENLTKKLISLKKKI